MGNEPVNDETIAAVATPPGRGGVGIVRVSGLRTVAIAKYIIGQVPKPRRALFTTFLDAEARPIDEGIAIFFPSPQSFTGEDVLELQGHGGPVVMDLLLKRVLSLGARLARPGEFSERAYLNDKIDLAQAEAVADLIESQTERAARCALRSLQGEFSKEVHKLADNLIEFRTYIEASLDFPEEEIDFLAEESLAINLERLRRQLQELMDKARQGSLLREGIRLVITGRPNAGKSSLLNKLAGHDAAIVSHIPGTTRDVMHREVQLDGIPVEVIDTAGLQATSNPIEREGMRRAWKEIESADLVLLIIDATCGYTSIEEDIEKKLPQNVALLRVWNKLDLVYKASADQDSAVYISAKTGQGLGGLRGKMKSLLGVENTGESVFIARRRHMNALERAKIALDRTSDHLRIGQAGELMAEELLLAHKALGEITGEFSSDDLLGKIFSSFCIGK